MNVSKLLDKFSNLRICVVGDLITDVYVDGVVERISPEAPVPILRVTGWRENPGGAGNVVENLTGLGCEFIHLMNQDIPIKKTRVMSGDHHLLRMDEESTPKWDNYDRIKDEFEYCNNEYDCVVISDYHKGMISYSVARGVIEFCNKQNIPVVVDTKNQHSMFNGATIVKCNRKEWNQYSTKINSTPWAYLSTSDIKYLVVTEGENGIFWYGLNHESVFHIAGIKTDIHDPCGAGDTVTAVLAAMIAAGESIHSGCELANFAAAKVCRHPGVYPIQKKDLLKYRI